MSDDQKRVFTEQDKLKKEFCLLAMEAALPACAETRLTNKEVSRINNVIESLQCEAREHWETSNLYEEIPTGSRAEGFALEDGWGVGNADIDTMYIHGGAWTVQVREDMIDPVCEPHLDLDNTGCSPGYGRVRLVGNIDTIIENMSHQIGRGHLRHATVFVGAVITVAFLFALSYQALAGLVGIAFLAILFFMPTHVKYKYSPWGEAYDALAIFDFIRKKYQIASICNIWHIPKEIIAHCFQQIDASSNIYYLSSSMRIMNVLGDFGYGQNKQGPSQVMGGNDHVPGLLCSKPFKAMDNFRRRQRESWPKEDTLSKIIRLPGVLVPTGNKGSLYRDIEWRESYSLPEFMLSQDMPAWVKIAHRAVKYTLKSQQRNIDQGDICTRSKFSIKNPLLWIVEKIANYLFNHFLLLDYELPYAELEGRSMISSYHIKTILMWELEINYRSHRQNSCPFQLMRNMLQRLDTCLNEGKIPNYFNPDCNLLENVAMEHIISTKNNINRILQDPLKSLVLCPQNPEKVYGHVKPDELLCNLKELFMDTTKNNFHQRADYMQSTLHALDKFRYSKHKTLCRLDDIPHESAALVSMLDLFREKCKAMCRLAIVPSEKMATNHLVDTFWGQIDKDLCRWSIIQQEAMLSSVDRCDIICLENMFIQLMKNVWQALANTMTC